MARAALLACIVLLGACRAAPPLLSMEQRAALELAVYRALLAQEAVAGVEVMTESHFHGACRPPAAVSPCWTTRVPQDYAAALGEYLAINDTSHSLDPEILDTLRAEQRRSPSAASTGPGDEPTEIFLSRVGFDAQGRRAMATIERRVGRGPYPGGGFMSSRTCILEWTSGHFSVVASIESVIT